MIKNLNELYKTDPSNEIFNDFVNSNDKKRNFCRRFNSYG